MSIVYTLTTLGIIAFCTLYVVVTTLLLTRWHQ